MTDSENKASLVAENKSVEEVPLINIPPITPLNIVDDQNSPISHWGKTIDKAPLRSMHKLQRGHFLQLNHSMCDFIHFNLAERLCILRS